MAESPKPFYLKLPILIAIFVIFLVGVGVGVFFYLKSSGNQNVLGQQAQNSPQEAQVLVETVGKIYELPTGEVPTIATVSDVNKLSQQEFFKSAQNGDKVLIYTKAKKAILYRPATNKIVEVGPVNIDETQASQNQATGSASPTITTASPTPAQEIKVALWNGTKTTGLTRRFEPTLTNLKDVPTEITVRTNATNDYKQTTIVDLTGGKQKAALTKLSTQIKGSKVVTSLPAGEERPANTDIIIILGDDFAGNQ